MQGRAGLRQLVRLNVAAEDSRTGGKDTEGMPDGHLRALSPGTATSQGTDLLPASQRRKATGTAGNAKLPSQLLACGLFLMGDAHMNKGLCSRSCSSSPALNAVGSTALPHPIAQDDQQASHGPLLEPAVSQGGMGQRTGFVALQGCSQLLTARSAHGRADLFVEAERVRSDMSQQGTYLQPPPPPKERERLVVF